jgi:hypothetical protein
VVNGVATAWRVMVGVADTHAGKASPRDGLRRLPDRKTDGDGSDLDAHGSGGAPEVGDLVGFRSRRLRRWLFAAALARPAAVNEGRRSASM